jgi:tRNA(fMet)-specific endonuclease VapC
VAGLVVVDTDLLIDYLRGRGTGTAVVRELIVAGTLRLTAITGFELRVGTDFVDRREDILRLFRRRTLPVTLPAALRAGEVAAELRGRGEPIGFADCLQAGVCLHHGLPLATRNRHHFERIEGLELVDAPD